jgi:ribosomal protein L3
VETFCLGQNKIRQPHFTASKEETPFNLKIKTKEFMKNSEKIKLKMKLKEIARFHKVEPQNDLIEQVINFIEIKKEEGLLFEVIGATKGDGFFEYDLKVKEVA